MTDTLIIYHANCLDGFGAAYAAREHFKECPHITYHPGFYQSPPPDTKDKHVIMVDFSYPHDICVGMLKEAASVLILDHHVSAWNDLKDKENVELLTDDCTIDLSKINYLYRPDRSGCMIAWEFFNPNEPSPALFNYIQDRDLWQFRYAHTKAICAALFEQPMTFEAWDKLSIETLIEQGEKLLIAHNQEVKNILDKTMLFVEFEGCYVPLIECEPKFMSDVGNILSLKYAFVLMFQRKPDAIIYSLRSNADNPRHVDVSEIAKKYGGGGHKHAAGFKVDQPLF